MATGQLPAKDESFSSHAGQTFALFGFLSIFRDGNFTWQGLPMTGLVQICDKNLYSCHIEGPPLTIEPVFGSFSATLNVTSAFISLYGTGTLEITLLVCPSKESMNFTKETCTISSAILAAVTSVIVSDPRPQSSRIALVVPEVLPPSGVVPVSGVAEYLIGVPVAGAVIDITWQLGSGQGTRPPLVHGLGGPLGSALCWLCPNASASENPVSTKISMEFTPSVSENPSTVMSTPAAFLPFPWMLHTATDVPTVHPPAPQLIRTALISWLR
jgi:hypothetical protein